MSGLYRNQLHSGARWAVVAIAGLALGACKDSGLPGKNLPLNEGMQAEWRYAAYEKTPAAAKVMTLEGHRWQITGAQETVPTRMLRSVATVNGAEVFSLKWDEAPYDRLYTAGENGRYSVIANID